MKVYLHYDSDAIEFVKVVKLSPGSQSTIQDVLEEFATAFNKKHAEHQQLDLPSLTVWNTKGKQYSRSAAVTKVCQDLDDLTVRGRSLVKVDEANTNDNSTIKRIAKEPTVAVAAPKAKVEQARPSPVLQTLYDRAREAMSNKSYRRAVGMYEQVLLLDPHNKQALLGLCEVWEAAGNGKRSLDFALRALNAFPEDILCLEMAGKCLCAADRPIEGFDMFTKAMQLHRQGAEGVSGANMAADALRLQALCAYALVLQGGPAVEGGAALAMGVLKVDETQWEALLAYARAALSCGVYADAASVLLRALVTHPAHDGLRAMLAQCLQTEAGMAAVRRELCGSEGGAAALAFLATAVKDHGAVNACIALYEDAVAAVPRSAALALNLTHARELTQNYGTALAAAASHCRRCEGEQLGGRLRLGAVADLLEELPPLPSLTSASWLTWRDWTPPEPLERRRKRHPGEPSCIEAAEKLAATEPKVAYSAPELDALALVMTAAKLLFAGGALPAAAALCGAVEPARCASCQPLHLTLIRNEAAYYGCVLQLLRDHPPHPWGWTTGAPVTATGGRELPEPLFLVGDSHTLPGAWRRVRLRGRERLLWPCLVTGVKIWHLRPGSEFYPKVQFWNTVNALPRGCQAVMLLGEIDCREGLLLATEKCKYETLQEGIDHSVSLYVDLLQRLARERDMELFVHPVPPVLNETRHIVRPFVAALRRRLLAAPPAVPAAAATASTASVKNTANAAATTTANGATTTAAVIANAAAAAAGTTAATTATAQDTAGPSVSVHRNEGSGGSSPSGRGDGSSCGAAGAEGSASGAARRGGGSEVGGRIHYLDFFDDLLTPDGAALRPGLEFDGTHLAPAYLQYLSAALEKL